MRSTLMRKWQKLIQLNAYAMCQISQTFISACLLRILQKHRILTELGASRIKWMILQVPIWENAQMISGALRRPTIDSHALLSQAIHWRIKNVSNKRQQVHLQNTSTRIITNSDASKREPSHLVRKSQIAWISRQSQKSSMIAWQTSKPNMKWLLRQILHITSWKTVDQLMKKLKKIIITNSKAQTSPSTISKNSYA